MAIAGGVQALALVASQSNWREAMARQVRFLPDPLHMRNLLLVAYGHAESSEMVNFVPQGSASGDDSKGAGSG